MGFTTFDREPILFIIFMLIYSYFIDKYFSDYWGIAAGIGFIMGGVWGLLVKQMLFKTGFTGKNQAKIVNWIFIIGGLVIVIYFIIERN